MKKNIIISLFISTLLIALLFLNNKAINSNYLKNVYIKNESWNTDFVNEVPYKKNDNLELLLFIENKNSSSAKIDYSEIEKNINIKKIIVNDQEINKNDKIELKKWVWVWIIIEGSAKNNWIFNNDTLKVKYKIEEINNDFEEKIYTLSLENKKIKFNLSKKNFETYKDNLIQIYWENLDFIKELKIWNYKFSLNKIWDNYYLPIEKNTIKKWTYNITLTDYKNNNYFYKNLISFNDDENNIKIYDIVPKKVDNKIQKKLVIQWVWFSKIISIQINNNTILESSSFEIISDNLVIINLPKNLLKWNYYLNIMWTDKIYEIKNIFFTIN